MRVSFVILAVHLAACGPTFIKGPQIAKDAEIEDTPANRELIDLVERYRLAMQERDTRALLALASRNYYERAGTTQTDDDYGYDKLGEVLEKKLSKLVLLRMRVMIDRVAIDNDRALVDYTYTGRYLVKAAGSKKHEWAQKSWESRLRFEKLAGKWYVTSGM